MSNTINIRMIPTDKIYSHPHNPRTTLGDLTELTDSIRAMGVLQNLTVVPYSPTDHPGIVIKNGDGSDCFVAVIGNRRHAAAKKAGLTEVPCFVSDMDIKEQIRTMQVENLLREGLTAYQEAKSIQLMMDLGDTVEDIAKSTGFSESKVRQRAKLATLDQDALSKTEGKNITMKELLAVADLSDESLRTEVLAAAGTKDFQNKLCLARSRIRDAKTKADKLSKVQTFASPIAERADGMVHIQTIYNSTELEKIREPEAGNTEPWYYIDDGWCIDTYRYKTPGEVTADLERQVENERLEAEWATMQEANHRAYESRVAFMKALTPAKAKKAFSRMGPWLIQHANAMTGTYNNMDYALCGELFEAKANTKSVDMEAIEDVAKASPEYAMILYAYAQLENTNLRYAERIWRDGKYQIYRNTPEKLNRLYDLLLLLDYQLCTEEEQLRDGTHPLYPKEAKTSDAA